MTYVIGIKRFGTTAILVDSAVSRFDSHGRFRTDPESVRIKNGLLYPGCTYAFAGNIGRAYQCIEKIRANVASQQHPLDKWEALEATVRVYQFPVGQSEQFDLMLSTRHSGMPDLFVIDSKTEALHRVEADICTLGSGRDFMDVQQVLPFAGTMLAHDRIVALEEKSASAGGSFKALDYPYLLSFLIHLSTLGAQGRSLYDVGVGGIVHFITQDSCSENRQRPALHVFAFEDPESHVRTLYRRRIAFELSSQIPHVLVVCDKHYEQRAEWALALQAEEAEVTITQEEAEAIFQRHERDVPYYFMAAGVIDWQRFGKPFFVLVDSYSGKRRPWADVTDYLDPFVEDQLLGYMAPHGHAEA